MKHINSLYLYSIQKEVRKKNLSFYFLSVYIPDKKENAYSNIFPFSGNNNNFIHTIYTDLKGVNRAVYFKNFTHVDSRHCKLSKKRVGEFLNVLGCLIMATVSQHTGSAPATHRTKSGSNVILADPICPFTTQRGVYLHSLFKDAI